MEQVKVISLPDFSPNGTDNGPFIKQNLGVFSRTLINPAIDHLLSSLLVVVALVLVDGLATRMLHLSGRRNSLNAVKKEFIAMKKWSVLDMVGYIRTNSVAGVGGKRSEQRKQSKRLIFVWVFSLGAVLAVEVLILTFSLPRQIEQTIEGSFLHMYPSRNAFPKSLSESCVRVNMTSDKRYSDSGKTAICALRFPVVDAQLADDADDSNVLMTTSFPMGFIVAIGHSSSQEFLLLFARSISTSGGTLVHASSLTREEHHGFHSIAFRATCNSSCSQVTHYSALSSGSYFLSSTWPRGDQTLSFEKAIIDVADGLLSQTKVSETPKSPSMDFALPFGNISGLINDRLKSSNVTVVRTKEGPKLSLMAHVVGVATLLVLNGLASFLGRGDDAVDLALVALRSRIGSDACACGLFAVESDTSVHLGLTQTGPNMHHLDVYPTDVGKYDVSDSDTVC